MPLTTLTVDDIASIVGHDAPVNVIDVSSQAEMPLWTLKQWADYFCRSDHRPVYNVISLEISGTKLADQIRRPRLVRELDWIDHVWPDDLRAIEYPKVQLYCLMSVGGCYTDFHIDFGGTSVFYHIVSGGKVFFFVEPTKANLRAYEKWSSSPDQGQTFFGDLVECYRVELTAGNTMFIPSGWIHAVYTPVDSIVFGGNFLHSYSIGMQIEISKIEERTDVPQKFRFPHFVKIMWFAAMKYKVKLDSRAIYRPALITSNILRPRRGGHVNERA